ncbi:MAG: peptide chain release factor N(5)-glutamine methyltransferase [Bacteroidota bacterium]
MTTREAQQKAQLQLKILYDEREAVNITDWVMEHITGKKRIDRLLDKQAMLTTSQEVQLDTILQELATHKPIQYVLGEAWFAGMKFLVNEHVLIPRPETEELVDWIVGESKKSKIKNQKLLDIGTGSGCIPVSLKKLLPEFSVSSVDVSKEALEVAQKNAAGLHADINFLHFDFLDQANWDQLPVVDIIVSNPPYIKQSEHGSMSKNVLDFEPSIALFVPDEDALLFYRKIALFSKTHLSKGGSIFLEINEALGKEIIELYESNGYTIELRKDMQGKDRMARIYHPR